MLACKNCGKRYRNSAAVCPTTLKSCEYIRIEDDKDRSGDALASAAIAAVTNSAILGAVLGGDIGGAILGDFLNGGSLDD